MCQRGVELVHVHFAAHVGVEGQEGQHGHVRAGGQGVPVLVAAGLRHLHHQLLFGGQARRRLHRRDHRPRRGGGGGADAAPPGATGLLVDGLGRARHGRGRGPGLGLGPRQRLEGHPVKGSHGHVVCCNGAIRHGICSDPLRHSDRLFWWLRRDMDCRVIGGDGGIRGHRGRAPGIARGIACGDGRRVGWGWGIGHAHGCAGNRRGIRMGDRVRHGGRVCNAGAGVG
mmetsp:Transcript_24610/g.42188  ORF Transcript_24610/g.42188 Transcript_24610/m.42188 type:complete len:227 (+) Transcript_24610:1674-2354(+)